MAWRNKEGERSTMVTVEAESAAGCQKECLKRRARQAGPCVGYTFWWEEEGKEKKHCDLKSPGDAVTLEHKTFEKGGVQAGKIKKGL